MGVVSVAHTKPDDLQLLDEDLADAPLLPKGVKDSPKTAAYEPPVDPTVDRKGVEVDGEAGLRKRKNGFQTDLCDCCAQPGGVELCKRT